jgi:hypothetical protein
MSANSSSTRGQRSGLDLQTPNKVEDEDEDENEDEDDWAE